MVRDGGEWGCIALHPPDLVSSVPSWAQGKARHGTAQCYARDNAPRQNSSSALSLTLNALCICDKQE